jgi:hypothetical protein
MNLIPLLRRGCALAAMAAACAAPAHAGGDIVKCVAADGQVTLTDSPCAEDASSVVVSASAAAQPAQAAPSRPALIRTAMAAPPAQHDNWVDPRPHDKMFSRDAATLRAARTSLQVLDEAASSARQQRVASR